MELDGKWKGRRRGREGELGMEVCCVEIGGF